MSSSGYHLNTLVSYSLLAALLYYLTTAALRLSTHRRLSRTHNCKPAPRYPHLDPLLGLDRFWALNRARSTSTSLSLSQTHHARHGATFRGTMLGSPYINTSQSAVIKAVHASSFTSFGLEPLRLAAMAPSLGAGIFNTDGAAWEHSRALLRPSFARSQIADAEALERHTARLVALVPRDGTATVDLAPLFKRWGLDTSTEFIFGQSTESLLPEPPAEGPAFLKAYDEFMKVMVLSFFFGRLFPLVCTKQFYVAREHVYAFVDRNVARALNRLGSVAEKAGGEKQDGEEEQQVRKLVLAEEMARETQDPMELRYQLLQTFLPAKDGAAVLLTNIFFHLAREPEAWTALRAEVTAIDPEQSLSFDFLKSLSYTQACLKEALRLNPPVPSADRICLKDTIVPLGGGPDCLSPMLVTAGTVVEADIWTLQRDPAVWGPDAALFRPARWTDIRPLWDFVPFLGGARICPAQQMMYVECAYVVVRFAQEFKGLECRDPTLEWVEEIMTGAQSRNGAKVCLIPA